MATKESEEKPVSELSHQTIVYCQNYIAGGADTVSSADRSIKGSFNNSKFEGNTNIQSDNNNQIQNISKDESEKAFQELFAEIKEIQNDSDRDQAEMNAESLQEAFIAGDIKKGQRLLKLLQGTLGTVSSLASIACFFGVTI